MSSFVKNGDNFCTFEFIRIISRVIDSLKMQARDLAMSDFTNLSKFTGMLNGPVDFPFFKGMMISSISKRVTGEIKK